MTEQTDRLMEELAEIINERQTLIGMEDNSAAEKMKRQSRIVELKQEIDRRRKELDDLW